MQGVQSSAGTASIRESCSNDLLMKRGEIAVSASECVCQSTTLCLLQTPLPWPMPCMHESTHHSNPVLCRHHEPYYFPRKAPSVCSIRGLCKEQEGCMRMGVLLESPLGRPAEQGGALTCFCSLPKTAWLAHNLVVYHTQCLCLWLSLCILQRP